MRVYRVTPDKGLNSWTENDLKNMNSILEWLKDAEIGTVMTIEVNEMAPEEYEKLPEYAGP